MAAATGSFKTYDAVGLREDLTDMIYDISPTATPFMQAIGRSKAKAVTHEWQTDSLAAASSDNAQVEGFDAAGSTSTPTARVQNICQIFAKDVVISGTEEVADKAGRASEMAYQMAKRAKEIKRDIEKTLLNNQGQVAGDSTTARRLRGLPSWLSSNSNRGSSGASSTAPGNPATDAGTTREFTETILKDVIQQCFVSGAEPQILMVGPVNKQYVSDFTGRAGARQMIGAEKIQQAASLYASDFGDLRVVPNRFQRERDAFVLDPEFASVGYFRNFRSSELAKTGDSEKKLLLAELTLEMKNEAAHGVAADLNSTYST